MIDKGQQVVLMKALLCITLRLVSPQRTSNLMLCQAHSATCAILRMEMAETLLLALCKAWPPARSRWPYASNAGSHQIGHNTMEGLWVDNGRQQLHTYIIAKL